MGLSGIYLFSQSAPEATQIFPNLVIADLITKMAEEPKLRHRIKEVMRRSRTTRYETLREAALFFFSVAVPDETFTPYKRNSSTWYVAATMEGRGIAKALVSFSRCFPVSEPTPSASFFLLEEPRR